MPGPYPACTWPKSDIAVLPDASTETGFQNRTLQRYPTPPSKMGKMGSPVCLHPNLAAVIHLVAHMMVETSLLPQTPPTIPRLAMKAEHALLALFYAYLIML